MKFTHVKTRAIVKVPATTANLGPGFDCLGVSLALFNEVQVNLRAAVPPFPMAQETGDAFWNHVGMEPKPFGISIRGDVPRSRGLGSSVTVRLGVLLGLNALFGNPLSVQNLFLLCSRLEGHPDNAAPACFGGFTVAWEEGYMKFPVSSKLDFVLLVPEIEMPTAKARIVLPTSIPREQGAISAANSARIVAAFATKNYAALKGAFVDGLHQPYRAPLLPCFCDVVRAAEDAGALGAFLSGSGSTIAAISLGDSAPIAEAMRAVALAHGVGASVKVVKACNEGPRVSVSSS